MVNNAGITRDATLHRMSYQMWEEVIHTNLTSCFNLARLTIDSMRERGFGRIVNIGSINGQAGQYGQVNYAAAKSGIHGFTKALAQEGAAKNITVNAIAPGYVDTDMVRAVPPAVLERSPWSVAVWARRRHRPRRDVPVADNADFVPARPFPSTAARTCIKPSVRDVDAPPGNRAGFRLYDLAATCSESPRWGHARQGWRRGFGDGEAAIPADCALGLPSLCATHSFG